jgi:hypothetical protein
MSRGGQTMPRQPVRSCVKRPGLLSGGLVGLFAGQIARENVVADCEDSALAISGEADALDGVRAVRRDVKDLLPCQRRFHRPLELSRRDGRQNGIGVHPELAAESAADEAADQPHILNGHLQGRRDGLLPLVQHLVCGVEDQLVAVPHRQRGMWLHHGVTLQRRGVCHVDLHRGAGERSGEIAYGTVGCRSIIWERNSRLIEVSAERVFSA